MFCLFADLIEAGPTRPQTRALSTISMKKKYLRYSTGFYFCFGCWEAQSTITKIMKYINSLPDPAGSSLTLGPLTPSSQVKEGVQTEALPCSVSPSLSVSQQTPDHPSDFLVALLPTEGAGTTLKDFRLSPQNQCFPITVGRPLCQHLQDLLF